MIYVVFYLGGAIRGRGRSSRGLVLPFFLSYKSKGIGFFNVPFGKYLEHEKTCHMC